MGTHTSKKPIPLRWAAVALTSGLLVTACSSGSQPEDSSSTEGTTESTTEGTTGNEAAEFKDSENAEAVVANYAEGVYQMYTQSVTSAKVLDTAINDFVADPTEESFEAAKQAWLDARDDYGPTEAFRFYGGPIDNEEDGPEGLINAWPLDEAYIDYVDGDNEAGIINDAETFPTINAELLTSLNEKDGETNISTGWHAIEFLLWGQDLDEDGPGARPVEDYTTNTNADRRGNYLTVASANLVENLEGLVAAWQPDADNYRAEFEGLETSAALTHIFTGIGELSRGELAGERMNVAYAERSQEDEHSCFSDNTTADIIGNAKGIQIVLNGEFPNAQDDTSLIDLVGETDAELAATLTEQVTTSVSNTEEIPAPFDQHLAEGVSDDDPGRASILTAIESLETQTDSIVEAADVLGVPINVS